MKDFFKVIWLAFKTWVMKKHHNQVVQENLDNNKLHVTNNQVESANNLNELIDNISGRKKDE